MNAIETDRLIVRNFHPDDWLALQEIVGQYQATEYAAYDREWPSSPEELRRVTEWFVGQDGFLAVCRREAGDLIGLVTINPDGTGGTSCYNLGFIFHSRAQGQGYASEAGQAVLHRAFTEWGAREVISGTALVNRRAVRLLERMGFRRVAESRSALRIGPSGVPIVFTGVSFAMTRDEWASSERG